MTIRSFSLLFTLFLTSFCFGQKNYVLSFSNEAYKGFKKNITTTFKDSIQAKKYLTILQFSAIDAGYLLCSVDTLHYLPSNLQASFYLGPHFEKANLELKAEDLAFFKKFMPINEKFVTGIPFRAKQLSSTLRQMQECLEDNGYPFGKVFLDSIAIEQGNLLANVVVQKNTFNQWIDIHIKGDSSVSIVFLSNIIRIKKGDKYSQEELRQISRRLGQINFLKEIKPHEILFTREGAELYLYIKSNPISSVNGVIGLQPDPKTSKVNVTGDLSLKLLNVLKRGELLEFNWKSIQPETQSLKGKINYPFIFQTPFGIDSQFNLYKRDSSYLEIKSTLGIQYFLKGGNYFKVFYQNYTSSVLAGGSNNVQFVNLGFVKSNNYGLSILRKQVDYVPNPSRGLVLSSELAIGSRKSYLNDTSQVNLSTTYRGELNVEVFLPVSKRHIVRLSSQTEFYTAPKIYQNEVARFGGLTTQRGFNEEELFSTTKSLFSIEYRYLLEQNSRAFLFYDQSWYENNATNLYYKDIPFGVGAGYSFGTNIGVFSISYAIGKQLDNPILIKNGKIHFGYIAYF
jgi:outer membrane protein assembly factor BamA